MKRPVTLAAIGAVTVVILGSILAYTSIQKYEKEVQINAQTEIEKTKIEEAAKVERTKTHLKWLPWN